MKLSARLRLLSKALLVIAFSFSIGLRCEAQSIVGKWHRSATGSFKIDKATGKVTPVFTAEQQKQYDQISAENGYTEVLTFRSNNTFTSIASAKGMKPIERTDKYSLSGNNLDLNAPLVHNEKTTITIKSIDATTMVWDLVFMDKLTRITYTRE